MSRPNLFGMEPSALAAVVDDLGEPGYRARQIHGWLYTRRVRRLADMSELPKALRSRLEERFSLKWPEVSERTLSFDGTRKYLFRLDDGVTIEAGPSRHNNSQGFYLYAFEPGGNRVEVYNSGFFVFAPDFEPVVWDEQTRGTGVYWGAALPESFLNYATPDVEEK